ncbi:MAG: alpha/beta fold hydrolase [Acidobacteriota bacterium]
MTSEHFPFGPAPRLPDFLASRLPFERATYRLSEGTDAGRTLHFIDHGPRDGRPILMLHGNPTWSFLWRKVIADLPEVRCVAPDLLGLGLSSKLPKIADHSVDRHADTIAELVSALGLDDAILLLQDWGGPIGVSVGARLPERISGMVLGNTSVLIPDKPRGTSFHRFARRPMLSDFVFRVLGFPQNVLHKIQGDPASIRGPIARAYRWPLRRLRDRVAPLALARMVPDRLDHPDLPALRRGEAWARSFDGPIALVWGTKDPILGRALRWHEKAFPDAPVTHTEAGHFLQEEVPEELAAAVADVAGRAG